MSHPSQPVESTHTHMKKSIAFFLLIVAVLAAGFAYRYWTKSQLAEKIYVAVEGESKIVAINPATYAVVSTIDLSVEHDSGRMPYAPHNIQVSPDMKTVWVTANAGTHQNHTTGIVPVALAHGEEPEGGESDEVIVIDPRQDTIIQRIPIGSGLHLAHVVLTPDSSLALVTAQNEGAIYIVDAHTFTIGKKIVIPPLGTDKVAPEPHGVRISPDGAVAYIALLNGRGLGVLNVESGELSVVPLGGAAVQTAVTPDGALVLVSLYDTKELAVYDVATKELTAIKLPVTARGPVQLYPTPDSRFIYVADQGYYFGAPVGELVYKIDLQKREGVQAIRAGSGPHGVVVSRDGARVYVTNLLSNDVSIIDTAADTELRRVKVGKEPNGISIWVRE